MKKTILALMLSILCLTGVYSHAQALYTETITVTNSPTNIVVHNSVSTVIVRENSASPSAVFSITPETPGSAAVNLAAGQEYKFQSQAQYASGTVLGTIVATTSGPFTFILLESYGAERVAHSSGGGTGSGTVNSGTQYELGYYAGAGTAISGDPNITTDSSGDLTVGGILSSTPGSGLAGYLDLVGNTSNPALVPNTAGWIGPDVASFTAYGLQLPSAGPSAVGFMSYAALVSGISLASFNTFGSTLSLSSGVLNVAGAYQLPSGCSNTNVPQWSTSGSDWICASAGGGSGAPNTVTWGNSGANFTSSHTLTSGEFVGSSTSPVTEDTFLISSTTAVTATLPATAPSQVSGNMSCVILENSVSSWPFELFVNTNGVNLDGTTYTALAIDPGMSITVCSDGAQYHLANGALEYWRTASVGTTGVWSNGVVDTDEPGITGGIPTGGTGYVFQLNLQKAQTIGHATVNVTSAGTAETLVLCIFQSTSATSALWTANGTVNATGAVLMSASQITLAPGVYYLYYGQYGSAAATIDLYNISAPAMLNKDTGLRMATSSNGVSSTSCPSGVGTLTTYLSGGTLAVLFTP